MLVVMPDIVFRSIADAVLSASPRPEESGFTGCAHSRERLTLESHDSPSCPVVPAKDLADVAAKHFRELENLFVRRRGHMLMEHGEHRLDVRDAGVAPIEGQL